MACIFHLFILWYNCLKEGGSAVALTKQQLVGLREVLPAGYPKVGGVIVVANKKKGGGSKKGRGRYNNTKKPVYVGRYWL